jgi:hypothetical protein
MKAIIILACLQILACGSRRSQETINENFGKSMVGIEEIGTLRQITNDGRSIYPVFAPGDSIVFYQRLLVTNAADTFAYRPDELVKPYGINITNGQLYTLDSAAEFPSDRKIDLETLPRRFTEETVWGVASPDSNVFAFETTSIDTFSQDNKKVHLIYLAIGDSIRQLSYGTRSCYLDRFSNTGRYLTAVYGNGPTWLLLYDLSSGILYRTEHDSTIVDYLTCFSPNDSMMLFIRSGNKYKWGNDYFGDIWLLTLNKTK